MTVKFEGLQNSLAIPQLIANESLYRLSMNLIFPRISNRTYQHYFDNSIGDTVSVKRPYKARAQSGRILKTSSMIDKTIDISVTSRYHFGLEAVDEDMTIHIEDYGERYLEAGAEELAYVYDDAGGKELSNSFFFHNGGTGVPLDKATGQTITAHASKLAIPRKRRFAVMDPYEVAAISADVMEIDAPEMVTGAIREHYMGKYAGWNILESNFIGNYEFAAMPTTAMPVADANGGVQRGGSLVVDGVGNATVINKGTLFTIAGVYEVQPRGDRRSTGTLQTFVVTERAQAAANGTVTLKINPEINDGTTDSTIRNPAGVDFDGETADPNLDYSAFQTVTAPVAQSAVITFVGRDASVAAARNFRQALFFCGDALEYINVQLATPSSAVSAGSQVDDETGLAIRYLKDFDIKESTEIERLDCFFGVKNIYPELGIRYLSQKVEG